MPELPEVETVRLQLLARVKGKTIKAVTIYHQKTVGQDAAFARKLTGLRIAGIDRIGKLLIFSFRAKPDTFLLAHLKMTGQFFFVDKRGTLSGGGGHKVSPADIETLPGRHTRAAIEFDDGSHLYFNDMRLFGYLRLADSEGVAAARRRFGPEPISDSFDAKEFARQLRRKKSSIKAVLLDQAVVAGLGNIYVDEALFRSKIRPDRPANTLSDTEAALLARAATNVLKEAVKNGGTTFNKFLDTEGRKGGHRSRLKVFGRHGMPCPRCGALIKKTRVAGRGTHFCPHCQT